MVQVECYSRWETVLQMCTASPETSVTESVTDIGQLDVDLVRRQ